MGRNNQLTGWACTVDPARPINNYLRSKRANMAIVPSLRNAIGRVQNTCSLKYLPNTSAR
ncbi:hypothetical protein BDV33DRAFT_185839 [Aspergillus novoparasiticus]|uniref:Uncharacterized protein n=1 Tax=Aspergillus novoparasiticus TaxID=986946 RepID=A0A5N6E6L1_9EURO|nr:hypothetical protein BDV33DRAFT_185839 [Aspergillus novoparasiticus]